MIYYQTEAERRTERNFRRTIFWATVAMNVVLIYAIFHAVAEVAK